MICNISFCTSGLVYLFFLKPLSYFGIITSTQVQQLHKITFWILSAMPCLPKNQIFWSIFNNIDLFSSFWCAHATEHDSPISCVASGSTIITWLTSWWHLLFSWFLNASVASFQLTKPFDINDDSLVALLNLPSFCFYRIKTKHGIQSFIVMQPFPLCVPFASNALFTGFFLPNILHWIAEDSCLMGLVQTTERFDDIMSHH